MKIVKAEGKFSIDLKKTIVLVGIIGAGKTTIGKNLADRLQLQFLDADKEIEEAAGRRTRIQKRGRKSYLENIGGKSLRFSDWWRSFYFSSN